MNDDVVTNPAALPVFTVTVKALPFPLVKVIILLFEVEAFTKAFEADDWRAVIEAVTLEVKLLMLELNALILLV